MSGYHEYPIDSTMVEGKREISANGISVKVVKADASESSDIASIKIAYEYIDENNDAETAVFTGTTYKVTFPDSPPTFISKKEISVGTAQKTIASRIRESVQEEAYITFVLSKKYEFKKYFVALDDKDRIVKSKNAPTAISLTIDGDEIGYIIPGKEPKLLFKKDMELPGEAYFLSLVVCESLAKN